MNGKEQITVLLVDDDFDFGNIMATALQNAGFKVYYQNSLFGIENIIIKLMPSIIILDVLVGEENSLERINNIRLAAENIPLIFVSSNVDLEYEEAATANGAVLYLEKPFAKEKLVMWVKRYARCNDSNNSRKLDMGRYQLDSDTHILSYQEESERTLSNTEFATLKLLWINKGEVVPRQDFKDSVWKGIFCSNENLNNVVYNLRKYFSKDLSIHFDTLRGEGFRMRLDE